MNVVVALPDDKETVLKFVKKNLESTPYVEMYSDEDLSKQADIFLDPFNRHEKLVLLILSDEGEPIGLTSFEVLPTYGNLKFSRLTTAYLEPEYRGKNIMKEIREAFEHWSKRVGCSFCNVNLFKESKSIVKEDYAKYEIMYLKDIR